MIGFVAMISGPDGRLLIRPVTRQFIMSGMCGGFTTFSAMSLDTLHLLGTRGPGASALYIGLVVLGALVACWAGMLIGGPRQPLTGLAREPPAGLSDATQRGVPP